MNLAFLRERYSYCTTAASDIVRQLAFAGLAVVWVFKTEIDKQWRVPRELLFPAIVLVIALLSDFLQYVAGALVWGVYNRMKERANITEESEFSAPNAINWPTLVFFWLKILAIIVAYTFIIGFLAHRISG